MDDPIFDTFSQTHWSYYDAQIREDQAEEFEKLDYLAMFTNPKGVQAVRNKREGRSDGNVIRSADTLEEFEKQVEKMFGRPIKLK